MALYHYTANEEQALVKCLAEKLNEHNSVFTPQWIVSGHNATNNYLIEQIADKNGIAANIKFKQTIPLIEMIHSTLGLTSDKGVLIRNEQLTWFIDDVLKSEYFNHLPEDVQAFIVSGDQLKIFTLAEKLNGLFSSYQEEKPELIERWNKQEMLSENPGEIWQAHIWQIIKENLEHNLRDLSTIFTEVKTAILKEECKGQLKTHFPCLFFYGNLPYSKQLVEVLQALSKEVDVYIFRRTFSTNHDRPIIRNLGKVLERDDKLFENIPTDEILFTKPDNTPPENLLKFLQNDLVGNSDATFNYQATDDSLVIACSYSVAREVEALYHHLLSLFKENEDIAARDVCVVIPDIETYAPAIKTYFDYAHKKDYNGIPQQLLPYTIYDTSHRIYASPYAAIEALLRLEKDGFTSKNVVKLLDFDFIRERFGFKDTEILVRALDKANIRHGFAGDTTLETNLVSWQYGLKRLIYGFCLPPETADEVVNFDATEFIPVVDFEESDRFELIKLNEFIETLHHWLEKRNAERSLSEWITFLEIETLNVFISEESYDTSGFRRLLGQLDQVAQQGLERSYNYETIRYAVTGVLGNMDSGERIGFGGISFVSPSMFLSVPAKVYAFLGLNGSDFPRKVTKVSFDLSDEDRLTKTDYDKNLFLNILLAAEEKLYLSYIGNSTKDNSEIPPSSLVSELEAYLLSRFNSKVNSLIVRHPLHAFNSRYNKSENPLLNYFDLTKKQLKVELLNSDVKKKEAPELPEKNGKKVIQLKDLTNFMEDPVKHYFTKTLGVYMSDRTVDLAEAELFFLDNLQSWKVKDELVKAGLEESRVDEKMMKMKGYLPLSKIGSNTLKGLEKEVKDILENEKLNELRYKKKASIEIELELDDYFITGKLNSVYEETLLLVTPSSDKAKYQIRALMNYYVAFCQGEVKDLLYLSKGGEEKQINDKSEYANATKENLSTWCKKYEQGTKDLIYFDASFMEQSALYSLMKDKEAFEVRKLNKIILYDTILNINEKSIFPSEYFKYIAQNDGLLPIKKANSFFDMYNDIKEFTKPFKK